MDSALHPDETVGGGAQVSGVQHIARVEYILIQEVPFAPSHQFSPDEDSQGQVRFSHTISAIILNKSSGATSSSHLHAGSIRASQ